MCAYKDLIQELVNLGESKSTAKESVYYLDMDSYVGMEINVGSHKLIVKDCFEDEEELLESNKYIENGGDGHRQYAGIKGSIYNSKNEAVGNFSFLWVNYEETNINGEWQLMSQGW